MKRRESLGKEFRKKKKNIKNAGGTGDMVS